MMTTLMWLSYASRFKMARDYIRSALEVNSSLTIWPLAERVAENIVASLTHYVSSE